MFITNKVTDTITMMEHTMEPKFYKLGDGRGTAMKIVYTRLKVDAILATIWRATKLHHNLQIVCHGKDTIGHIISDSHFD